MPPEQTPEKQKEEQKTSLLAPLLTGLALLVLLLGFSFWLWQHHFAPRLAELAGRGGQSLAAEEARGVALAAEQRRLKQLLNLPPCEAKARLESGAARPPASGANVARGGVALLSRLLPFLAGSGSSDPSR